MLVGELEVLAGRLDVVEGTQQRAVGVGGGAPAEPVGDRRDLDRGVGGVQVGEVDAGEERRVERLAAGGAVVGLVDEVEEHGPGGVEAELGGGEVGIASGSPPRSPRRTPARPSRAWRATSSRAPRAMPSGTAASIGRMTLNTGIRHSGASGHGVADERAAVVGVDGEVGRR